MTDLEEIVDALEDGHSVRVETRDEGEWVFELGDELRAQHQDHPDTVRVGGAAVQRLEGWLTQIETEWEIEDKVYVGGLGAGPSQASEYCIIRGETSLCDRLYRRLGSPDGAESATTWDYQVSGRDDAPRRPDLCPDCLSEGGWDVA